MIRKVSSYMQVLLGLVVTCTVLWLGYTNGTGVSLEALGHTRENGAVTVMNFDGEGHPVELSYRVPPKRVIVTYPGATELLIALGLENHIAATLKPYGAEPPELAEAYEKLPKLDAPYVPSKEEVMAVQPDLIMGWNHHFLPAALGDIRYWYGRNIETYIVPATVRKGSPTVESTVYPFIDDVGRIFGISDRAESYKAQLDYRIQAVVERARLRGTSPSVMVLQSHGNSTYSVYGEKYIIHDIVRKAGGRPIVAEGMSGVGPERVLGHDPDYIVFVMTDHDGDRDTFSKKATSMLQDDVKLHHMRAVRENRIIPVPFGSVNNGNGRVVDALELIADGLDRL